MSNRQQFIQALNYSKLSEAEKIPLRIEKAKEIAIEDLENGVDLSDALEWCIANEQYCGAQGINRAIKEYNKRLN